MNKVTFGQKAIINHSPKEEAMPKAKVKEVALSRLFEAKEIRVDRPEFVDAFTQVASQTDSAERVVMKIEGFPRTHQVFLSKGLNIIQRIFGRIFNTKAYREYVMENQSTLCAFRQFLVEEYGVKKVAQVAYQFRSKEIDIDTLLKEKRPLTKEIIQLYNIGVNNIEQQDVDSFSKRLLHFVKNFREEETDSLKDALLDSRTFTVREIRGLLRKMNELCEGKTPTVQDLRERFMPYLNTVHGFNALVDMLMPHGEAFYTGRKIEEPIIGANYNAGYLSTYFQPWVDQQELLQVFEDLKEAKNWKSYFETLAKIVVKKHLIREDKHDLVRVGALIPAPKNKGGGWYRVQEAIVSGRGKMVYTLVPAHPDYDREMPVVRLYRDTTPSPYAMDSGPTITRDLYPDAPPGYLFSDVTINEDQAFFNQFIADVPGDLEDAKNKRHLALVGNSLGGSDAQIDLCRFFSNANKLPNTSIDLYAFSSPPIKREDNDAFANYILKNQDELKKYGINFNINHRVDADDFVPWRMTYNKGKVAKHLGYGIYGCDLPLKAKVMVHQKMDTEHEPLLRIAHLRVYAKAKKELDFFKEEMSVREFDDRYRTEFSLTRFVRKHIFCALSEAVWKLSRFLFGRLMEKAADENGIIHATYKPTNFIPVA